MTERMEPAVFELIVAAVIRSCGELTVTVDEVFASVNGSIIADIVDGTIVLTFKEDEDGV